MTEADHPALGDSVLSLPNITSSLELQESAFHRNLPGYLLGIFKARHTGPQWFSELGEDCLGEDSHPESGTGFARWTGCLLEVKENSFIALQRPKQRLGVGESSRSEGREIP